MNPEPPLTLDAPHESAEEAGRHARSGDLVAHLMLTLTSVAWGSSFVGVKLVVGDVPPMLLGLSRALLAAVLLLGYGVARRERLRLPRRELGLFLLLGALGVGWYYVALNLALEMTSVTDAALLGLAVPAMAALGAWLLRIERVGRRRLAGIVLALGGAAVLTLAGASGGGHSALGDLLVLSTGVGWTIYTLIGRGIFNRHSAIVGTAYIMLAGALVLAPAAAVEAAVSGPPTVTARAVAIVVYLGLICSGAGYVMWNTGLARLGAVRSSAYLYLQPVAAIAIALPVLGERPGWPAVLCGLVVVIGTMLAAGR